MFSPKSSTALLGLVSVAAAVPGVYFPSDKSNIELPKIPEDSLLMAPSCQNLGNGLTSEDCAWISQIGMADQGLNPLSNNGKIWIGDDGEYTFTFTNDAGNGQRDVPITVVIWDFPPNDFEASFMNKRQAQVTYSLPAAGDSVTISIARDISGAFSTLHNHETTLSQWGQIYNTWGEFTTGQWATVDVSRLVNMSGNEMEITVANNGCVSNMNRCSFHCKSGNECGDSGSYSLVDCANGSQPGASYGTWDGINPEGGCQGWGQNGHVDVVLRD